MSITETLRRALRRNESVAMWTETFIPDEQLILEIFSQSVKANTPEIILAVWMVRGKGGNPPHYHPNASQAVSLIESLEVRGYLERFKSENLPARILYRQISSSGKNAIKHIRKQQNAFRQTLTVNVPLESQR